MRIGILSDIHANREALEATLADMRGVGVERIVCLGDVVGYNTDPSPCIAVLREAGAVCVAGNHDRAVTRQIPTDGFSVRAIRAIAWTRKRLPPEDVAWLSALPLKTNVGEHLVAVHGALHVDRGCELVRLNSDDRMRRTAQALLAHPSPASAPTGTRTGSASTNTATASCGSTIPTARSPCAAVPAICSTPARWENRGARSGGRPGCCSTPDAGR